MIASKPQIIYSDQWQVTIKNKENITKTMLFPRNIKALLDRVKSSSKMEAKLEHPNVKGQWCNIMTMISLL